jgi:hypothetical protein
VNADTMITTEPTASPEPSPASGAAEIDLEIPRPYLRERADVADLLEEYAEDIWIEIGKIEAIAFAMRDAAKCGDESPFSAELDEVGRSMRLEIARMRLAARHAREGGPGDAAE